MSGRWLSLSLISAVKSGKQLSAEMSMFSVVYRDSCLLQQLMALELWLENQMFYFV